MDELFFEAMSNSHRRDIIQMLKWGNYSVNEITSSLGISQPSVSRHLDILKKANIVVAERRANRIIYSLNLSVMQEAIARLVEFLEGIKESSKYEYNENTCND